MEVAAEYHNNAYHNIIHVVDTVLTNRILKRIYIILCSI